MRLAGGRRWVRGVGNNACVRRATWLGWQKREAPRGGHTGGAYLEVGLNRLAGREGSYGVSPPLARRLLDGDMALCRSSVQIT